MLTTRYPVDFAYTDQELQALFRYAYAHDVEQGGRYDARSAAINVWAHHWLKMPPKRNPRPSAPSTCTGTPSAVEIETDEDFSLEDLMHELGRLELNALGLVTHGDVPHGGPPRGDEEAL